MASKGSMSLLPAVLVLKDARVYICVMYNSNVASNIEVAVNKGFSGYTVVKATDESLQSYIEFFRKPKRTK